MNRNKLYHKILKILLTIATTIVLLFLILVIVLKMTWKPIEKEKHNFSSSDISTIVSELSISEEKLNISKMRYTHAKDTVFHIYATSDTLSFLDSNYKYSNNYENKESYVCVNNNEIYCKVKNNNNKYELEFIIYDYNQKLIDIME